MWLFIYIYGVKSLQDWWYWVAFNRIYFGWSRFSRFPCLPPIFFSFWKNKISVAVDA